MKALFLSLYWNKLCIISDISALWVNFFSQDQIIRRVGVI